MPIFLLNQDPLPPFPLRYHPVPLGEVLGKKKSFYFPASFAFLDFLTALISLHDYSQFSLFSAGI